ncbi:hypothetical protein Lgra_1906 [Legionella gratiana]|uniref:Transmembrane protein n=1 Tax=Legionella gratiana TaxID=45066 RepID=A0A378JDF7_9GAMM|nr:hypothetical protein [Legionella gratiana]KTD10940.1 hypothetical protein Lgra_1906 [Legionella gratiana]STX45914.1 Uncharacterised protein [Legionella gratiana]
MDEELFIKAATEQLFQIFAQSIILMWALWISVVFLTDFCNLMVGFGLLPTNFPASSHNLDWIYTFLKLYRLDNDVLCLILFSIINLWVVTIAVFYWRAFISYYTHRNYYVYRTMQAFILNMSLFVCFLIADELFIQYKAGHTHMSMLLYIFTSLITFFYLLDKKHQKEQ